MDHARNVPSATGPQRNHLALAEPAHRPSSQAPVMWALSASLGWILPVIAQLVWWAVHPQPPWPHLAAAALTAVAMVVHIGVVPLWRYRVHRWEISPQAVFTRTGWLVQERRITPISRVQTVDTYRGPMDRLFGLGNVTVTTASSAGAVHIEALDTDVADRVVAQLTDIAALRGEDAT
ncbi:PH domain-containing protein [Mycobacterium tuberculosis]|uniref:PH domain-containing protein n=1 Tax=Mycobacterium tuberculosis TaxID=1773 RepID=UPI00099E5A45|nr:PH domain-containing protein [Mycobacterium tuberculosis]